MKRLKVEFVEGKLKEKLKPNEELLASGYANKGVSKHYLVGVTSERLILLRVSAFGFKEKETRFIPLDQIEAYSVRAGRGEYPDWLKISVEQALLELTASTLILKLHNEKPVYLNFPAILGYGESNKKGAFKIGKKINELRPNISTTVPETHPPKNIVWKNILISITVVSFIFFIPLSILFYEEGVSWFFPAFIISVIIGVIVGGLFGLFYPYFKRSFKGE